MRSGRSCRRRLSGWHSDEIDREEPVQAIEPFQLHLTALVKLDAVTDDKVVHNV